MKNRKIKFRAWDQEQKRMFPVYGFDDDHIYESTLDGPPSSIHPRRICNVYEFSGVSDMDGTPIYEGDIVKTPGGQVLQIEIPNIIFGDSKFHRIDIENCEIIGNIHENPELLNEK